MHTSSGGAKTRGVMLVRAYETLTNPQDITEESMKMAYVLGWCVELSGLIILDDIADNSTTRRGVLCWHRMPGVGMTALNDAILMITIVLDILMENFGSQPWYAKLLDIFNENDYADCYIDESISGKVGNDIDERQCSWLAVKALELCNQDQRKEFEMCYGSADLDCIKRIKNLYLSLGIPQLCRHTIRNLYANIAHRINKLPQDNPVPPALILKFLDMIYNMKTE